MTNQSKVERKSERELFVSRIIHGSSSQVFEAWSKAELFKQWWVPKSAPINLLACEMDVRTGGRYKLTFSAGDQKIDFFGKYLEVIPSTRLVWTNEEGGTDSATITTVTFEDIHGTTRVSVADLYPSKELLEEAIATGSSGAMPEQLEQLEELIVKQGRS